MTDLVIQFPRDVANHSCALCGNRPHLAEGLQLAMADRLEMVCRECGKKHAPSLVALMDLANAAKRVGHIGRHTVCPPLGALLDLARAAEDYVHATPPPRRQAV